VAETHGKMYHVGSLVISCPRCEAEITIPISAGIVSKEGDPSKLYVRTDSDVADYWSHSWAHKEGVI